MNNFTATMTVLMLRLHLINLIDLADDANVLPNNVLY